MKKQYERPAMQVIRFEQKTHLLQMSKNDPYNPGGDPLIP